MGVSKAGPWNDAADHHVATPVVSGLGKLEPERKRILEGLINQWRVLSAVCLSIHLLSFFFLLQYLEQKTAWRWLFQSVLLLGYTLWLLRINLPFNRPSNREPLFPHLGAGTSVTLFRGLLVSLLGGFAFLSRPGGPPWPFWLEWIPGGLYLLAGVGDFIDGYVARSASHETKLGEMLDAKLDALGLLIAPLVALGFGRLPLPYLAVGFAYYLFSFGIRYREKRGKLLIPLRPRPGSRMTAGFQMGFVGMALLPIFSPPATTIAACVFMTPLLLGFLRDWLVVSGRLAVDCRQRTRLGRKMNAHFSNWFPVCVRILLLCSASFSIEGAVYPSGISKGLYIIALLMAVSGTAGRVGALAVSLWATHALSLCGVGSSLTLLFACSLSLLLSGTGRLSIWRPEDRFLPRRPGERRSGPTP